MRKIAFLLLLLFIGYSTPTSEGAEAYSSLINVFDRNDFKLKEIKLSGWVKLYEYNSGNYDLKQTALAVCKRMKFEDSSAEEISENDDCVTIGGEYGDTKITVSVKTLHNDSEQKYETVASVDITQCSNMGNIIDIRRNLYDCLKEFGVSPHVNICIIKYIEGNLDVSERQMLLDNAFSSLDAEVIEGIKDDNLISISGYAKNLPYCIKSGSRDININAASRYSTYDNRTYFWLGTPVITSEY